ncbi:MAG: hypothetical protein R3B54_10700 [Bdellovibrionota bacterium]
MSKKITWLFVVGFMFAAQAQLEAKTVRVPDWMLVAVELQEHPVEIPDFDSLSFSTKLRREGEALWLDFDFSGKRVSLPEGYRVVASWSNDASFDNHSLRLRHNLKAGELGDLANGQLRLSIRALDHGFVRFEFWSPRGIKLSQSEARSF